MTLAEVLATSDLPGGVVNLLTGRITETAPTLAAHMDVNAIDLAGVADTDLAAELEGRRRRTSSGCSDRCRPTTTGRPTPAWPG